MFSACREAFLLILELVEIDVGLRLAPLGVLDIDGLGDPFLCIGVLRCQILEGAIHGDFIVVRTFARNAQQNRDREA
jgi:hypothetical protein